MSESEPKQPTPEKTIAIESQPFFPEKPFKETADSIEPGIKASEMTQVQSNPDDKYYRPFFTRPKASQLDFSKIAQYKIIDPERDAKHNNSVEKKFPSIRNTKALSIDRNPAFMLNDAYLQDRTKEQQTRYLVRFFKSGNLEAIIKKFNDDEKSDPEFENQIELTKQNHAEQLASATFLNKKDWRILTGLRLFNFEVFEHSVGTYLIAKDAIENDPEIATEITKEGLTLEQFYRACLFHDIGKMGIPEFILNDKTNDEKWVTGFMMLPKNIDEVEKSVQEGFQNEKEAQEYTDRNCQDDILAKHGITVPDSIRENPQEMFRYFEKNRKRAVDFVPISGIIKTDEQKKQLEEYGIDLQQPLKEIIRSHEIKSENILKDLGFSIEAFLAGNHHNYKARSKQFGEKEISLSTLHIASIIHMADMQHAMGGDRPYHEKQPVLRILAFIVDDAEDEIIDQHEAFRWIKNEYRKISPAYFSEVHAMKNTQQTLEYRLARKAELDTIENFLLDYKLANQTVDEEEEFEFLKAA